MSGEGIAGRGKAGTEPRGWELTVVTEANVK